MEKAVTTSAENFDAQKTAEQIDQLSKNRAAENSARIATVGDGSRELTKDLFAGKLERADFKQELPTDFYIPTDAKGDAVLEPSIPHDKVVQNTEHLQKQVIAQTDALQKKRMTRMHGDTQANYADLDGNTAGQFDETNGIQIDGKVSDKEEERILKHEAQHQEDGLPGHSIDVPLASLTGVPAIDNRLASFRQTERNILEKRAMMAEGGAPRGSYVQEHWNPTTELEERLNKAGQDFDAAVDAMIAKKSSEEMTKAIHIAALVEEGVSADEAAEIVKGIHEKHDVTIN